MNVQQFVDAIHRLHTGLRHPRLVADEHLQAWVEVANQHPDFWLRYQIAEILGELYPGDPTWGVVVLNWIREALHRRSAWAEELIVLGLRAWPELLSPEPVLFAHADDHPVGLARGILEAIRRKALAVDDLPLSWLEGLAELSLRLPDDLRRELTQVVETLKKRRFCNELGIPAPTPERSRIQAA